MKKAIVIGCPGSGKSTFARKLQKATGIPLYHLDMFYWNADKTTVEKSAFIKRLQDILVKDTWIIDGNYGSTMEMRLTVCDTVFFLDYPTDVCLSGIAARRDKPRSDMPWVESGAVDKEFISFVENYNKKSRPVVLTLLERYSNKNIIVFHTRDEADEFLKRL